MGNPVLELESFRQVESPARHDEGQTVNPAIFQPGTSIEVIDQRHLLQPEESMVTQHVHTGPAPRAGFPRRSPAIPNVWLCALLVAVVALSACGGRKKIKLPPPVEAKKGWSEVGIASWYGHPYHGRKTSNGETYDMNKMTAAHTRLPFGTWVNVENLANRRSTRVRINDRGPFTARYIIDLSRAAASEIRMIGAGTVRVRLTVISGPDAKRKSSKRRTRSATSRPAVPKGGYEIQIGSFKSQANAKTLAWAAKQQGHRVQVRPFRRGGPRLYRVVVAGGTREAANKRLRKLKSQGFKGFVRQRRGD